MMRTLISCILALALIVAFSNTKVTAQEKTDQKQEFVYGGVVTCKACHMVPKSGAQYKIWAKSPHANAYEALASPEAKEIAKKMGIEDPQKSAKCLKCHVTAFGVSDKLKGPKLTLEEGVSCEACHGAGSAYKSRTVMLELYEGKADPAKYGLVIPDEKTCVKCHNEESPTFKGFDYKKMVAQIAHPIPKQQ